MALPGESVYLVTGMSSTRCLAVEWGMHGINVNAVAPTFIRTPGTEVALSIPTFAQTSRRIAALHRVGEPDEVAGASRIPLLSAASLITGETLVIDGGWTLGRSGRLAPLLGRVEDRVEVAVLHRAPLAIEASPSCSCWYRSPAAAPAGIASSISPRS